MRNRNNLCTFLIIITLPLIQLACMLGEVMDANPPGLNTNHIRTLTAEVAQNQEQIPTQPDIENTATSAIAPPQGASPQAGLTPTNDEPAQINGKWSGTAQWLCEDNPSWDTTLDFRSNGAVSATLSNSSGTFNQDGTWMLAGNDIELYFQYGTWAGTVDGNTIQGTFADDACSGVWSVTRN
jgi:hypothetical protein